MVSVVHDTCAQTATCNSALVASSHIRHSPFVLKIVAGQTSPWNSDIEGSCAERACAKQACRKTLTLRDAYSKARTTGGDDVRASLQGPLAVPDRAGYGPKATTIRVYIREVGRYSLAVSIEASDVSASPFRLYVQGGFKLASMSWSSRTNAPQGLHLSSRPPSPQSVGAAWFRRSQRLTAGFVMDLSIQITPLTPACKNWRGRNEGGTEEWCVLRGGNGAALVLSKASASVVHHNDFFGEMPPNLGEGGGGNGLPRKACRCIPDARTGYVDESRTWRPVLEPHLLALPWPS